MAVGHLRFDSLLCAASKVRRRTLDDRVEHEDAIDLSGSPVRAKTVVIRCWQESGADGSVILRGSVRDLSRGRASAFEGFAALGEQLQQIIGEREANATP